MSQLFQPLPIRDVVLKNRIAVSPMCEYSAEQGKPTSWHLVHLGSRAVGGAGLVFTEATAVEPAGRISPQDTGIYDSETCEAWLPIVRFIQSQGAAAGIQLAHAGRKASTAAPWNGGKLVPPSEGGWEPIDAPSPALFAPGYGEPAELDHAGIARIVGAFRDAAIRSLDLGFDVVEIHGAHGYLIHQFLSPLSNQRTDAYGGSFENRTRFACEVVDAVRSVWPERLPLFLRLSCTDWVDGGWNVDDSVALAKLVRPMGVDLIDCSSGGASPTASIPVGPGYQVRFADRIKRDAAILTGAVGMITDPAQAEQIVSTGQADLVLLAREFLRDPYWPRRAARELGVSVEGPKQYGRAW